MQEETHYEKWSGKRLKIDPQSFQPNHAYEIGVCSELERYKPDEFVEIHRSPRRISYFVFRFIFIHSDENGMQEMVECPKWG